MIEKIIPALGISFCAFCIHEFMCHFFFGGGKAANIFTKILAIIDFFILICSAPVSIIIFMHDNRMRAFHEKEFRKEREPYESMMERKYQEALSEVDSLRISMNEQKERIFDDLEESYRSGYRSGYTDCSFHCANDLNIPASERVSFLKRYSSNVDARFKEWDEEI